MKSIYESIKGILDEAPAQPAPGTPAAKSLERGRALKTWATNIGSTIKDVATKAVSGGYSINNPNSPIRQAVNPAATPAEVAKYGTPKAQANQTPKTAPVTKARIDKALTSAAKPDDASKAREAQAAKSNAAQAPAGTNPSAEKPAAPAKVDTSAEKPATPAKAATPAQGKVDQQGAVNLPKTDTEARAGRVAEPAAKPEAPDTSMKGGGPLGVTAQAKLSTPSASTPPEVKTLDVTKPEKAEKPTGPMSDVGAAVTAATKKPEGGGPIVTTSADSEKGVVKSGTGGTTNLTTDSPDDIAKRGPMGTKLPEKKKTTSESKQMNINKKFNVSDALYQSVMEVMKSKEGTAPKTEKEKQLAAMSGDEKKITYGDVLKARGVTKEEVSVKENQDTPGNSYEHQCAIHVKSESFGEGRTITTQHADIDEEGNIAWYDVMFEHGIEKYVPTSELEILVSESHMHAKRKKKGM